MKSLIILTALILTSCGGEALKEAPKDSAKYEEIKPLIASNCAGSSCHGGAQKAFDSEERWLSSSAKARIESGNMPPQKKLAEDVKAKLLGSFN